MLPQYKVSQGAVICTLDLNVNGVVIGRRCDPPVLLRGKALAQSDAF